MSRALCALIKYSCVLRLHTVIKTQMSMRILWLVGIARAIAPIPESQVGAIASPISSVNHSGISFALNYILKFKPYLSLE